MDKTQADVGQNRGGEDKIETRRRTIEVDAIKKQCFFIMASLPSFRWLVWREWTAIPPNT